MEQQDQAIDMLKEELKNFTVGGEDNEREKGVLAGVLNTVDNAVRDIERENPDEKEK